MAIEKKEYLSALMEYNNLTGYFLQQVDNKKIKFMNEFLTSFVNKIRNHQKQLVDFSLLTDKSWFLVSKDISFDKVAYIFRSGNQLLISKNGDVTIAAWSIINHATQSILIEKPDTKVLYNIIVLSNEYLVLQKDGVQLFEVFVKQEKYDKFPKADFKFIESAIMSEIKEFLNAKNRQKMISKKSNSPTTREQIWGIYIRSRK
jgi:hypothetical protein